MINFKEILKGSDYDFLRKNEKLGKNIILLGLGGSHAYGTNVEGSDVDVRGVAVRSKRQILTGCDYEQVCDSLTDTTVYSFDKIVKLLCSCNPNTIEMLGLKPEHYLYLHPLGQELIDNRQLFLSKRAAHSFGGYATQQLRRLENKSARLIDQPHFEENILRTIKDDENYLKEKYFPYSDDSIRLYIDDAVNEDLEKEIFIDVSLKHYPLRDYKDLWAEMHAIVKSYEKAGQRNEKAASHNKLSKHMMHLVRLYLMCFDILERGEINTYREKEHDFLMEIRNGKYLDEQDQPTKEFFNIVDELEVKMKHLSEVSYLPDTVDMDKINDFVARVNERVCSGGFL